MIPSNDPPVSSAVGSLEASCDEALDLHILHISLQEVHHISQLARLPLQPEEAAVFTHDFQSILVQLKALEDLLDKRDVLATVHAVDLPVHLREDRVQPGLSSQQALHNAPERLGDGFGVPKMIE